MFAAMSKTSSRTAAPKKPQLDYPFETVPPTGQTVEVAPGVMWIRMPLPFTLNHINLWAIADGEGWAIVDTGVQSPETVAAWQQLLPGPLGGRPLTRVLVTHMHPDHVGMSGWLTRRFDCRLWMTRLEYLTCRVLVADTGREAPEDGVRFYRRAGWDDGALENYRARFGGFGKSTYALPDSYQRLRDGDLLRIGEHDWRVVVGHGHSPEHACLHCPSLKLLISGDQVLPRISSNVSVFPTEPDADPLGDWMDSLVKLAREVSDDVLVLPAHNEPFRGLHARLRHLAQGHERSLERLRASLFEPKRAIDVFGALFARRIDDPGLLGMATGESLAHLNYLLARGEARAEIDAQGVAWYRSA
jgi:glyoxylase-like metal-dependent hydrolase (beta-lactamase superfamily II)